MPIPTCLSRVLMNSASGLFLSQPLHHRFPYRSGKLASQYFTCTHVGPAPTKLPGPAPTKSPGILSKVPKVPKGRSAAKAPTSDHAVQAGVEEPLVRLVQVSRTEDVNMQRLVHQS
eukprot:scaffold130746_cov21-Tisochrysis_lutea.AAC.1